MCSWLRSADSLTVTRPAVSKQVILSEKTIWAIFAHFLLIAKELKPFDNGCSTSVNPRNDSEPTRGEYR